MTPETILVQSLGGLARAGVLFMLAAGLTLVFGALRVINFAHGSLYMVGAFVGATIVLRTSGNFWLALIAAPLVVALLGGLIEVSVLRRIYRREHLIQLLATYSLVLIVGDLVRLIWGAQYLSISVPNIFAESVQVAGQPLPLYNLVIITFACVTAVALWALFYRTGLGRDIRGAVSDPEMLGLVGVNVPALFTTVFMIGAFVAGLAGVIIAPSTSVGLGIDVETVVEAFAVTVIGGLGSFVGALIGAVIIGQVEAFGIMWVPRAALAFVFLAMAIVLGLRPYGLFGEPER